MPGFDETEPVVTVSAAVVTDLKLMVMAPPHRRMGAPARLGHDVVNDQPLARDGAAGDALMPAPLRFMTLAVALGFLLAGTGHAAQTVDTKAPLTIASEGSFFVGGTVRHAEGLSGAGDRPRRDARGRHHHRADVRAVPGAGGGAAPARRDDPRRRA